MNMIFQTRVFQILPTTKMHHHKAEASSVIIIWIAIKGNFTENPLNETQWTTRFKQLFFPRTNQEEEDRLLVAICQYRPKMWWNAGCHGFTGSLCTIRQINIQLFKHIYTQKPITRRFPFGTLCIDQRK